MKRIVCLFIAIIFCMTLVSCGNENWGIGNYTFKHVHFSDGAVGHCMTVESWHDNELGCEIHTPDGGVYLSEGTYQLFENENTCPYC